MKTDTDSQTEKLRWFSGWLEKFINYEAVKNTGGFSLETMRLLAEKAGNPQDGFRSIHVAGSKGKGSVSAMLAAILTAGGRPCGLYTSPHLQTFLERVTGPDGFFPDSVYEEAARFTAGCAEQFVQEAAPGIHAPSWFELVTLFAMRTFCTAGLPWAVFETGLGGRLDATNILHPQACVLTPVELEHTEYLGSTLEKIAAEKAGIFKSGVPVFSAAQKPEVQAVFRAQAARCNAPLYFLPDAVSRLRTRFTGRILDAEVSFRALPGGARFRQPLRFSLRMPAAVQAENAALAAYACKTLFPETDESVIGQALSGCFLPGRFEILPGTPPVVLDGAHTENSMRSAVQTFCRLFPPGKSGKGKVRRLLFACAADKNVQRMSALFRGKFSGITLTCPGGKKPGDLAAAEAAFRKNCALPGDDLRIIPDWNTAIRQTTGEARQEGAPLLITGSFYLVAEAKNILCRPPDPEIPD